MQENTETPRKRLRGEVSVGHVLQASLYACLRSTDLADRAIGYEIATSTIPWRMIEGFVPSPEIPLFCLEYLLDCVRANRMPKDADEDIHTRAEALFELMVPMADFWSRHGCGIPETTYWERIESLLVETAPDFIEEFATHFLKGVDRSLNFKKRIPV